MHYFCRILSPRCLAPLALLLAAGCGKEAEIVRYTVPKPSLADVQGEQDQTPTDRTLAALARHEDQAWFFKLTGPLDKVERQETAFDAFLKSVQFSDKGEPQWTLPADWTHQTAGEMTHAAFRAGVGDDAVNVTVTKLSLGRGNWSQYTLDNVNRWRRQLTLPPLHRRQLEEAVKVIESNHGIELTLADMRGQATQSSMGQAPVASMAGAGASPPAEHEAPAASETQIQFEAPKSWRQGQEVISRGGITIRRDAAYLVGEGANQAEITITAAFGSTFSNVNRWRGQVGLEPVDDVELKESLKSIDVGGKPADYVELVGPEGASRQATLGVIAQADGKAWFIKMTGAAATVAEQKPQFEQFVRSIRFANE